MTFVCGPGGPSVSWDGLSAISKTLATSGFPVEHKVSIKIFPLSCVYDPDDSSQKNKFIEHRDTSIHDAVKHLDPTCSFFCQYYSYSLTYNVIYTFFVDISVATAVAKTR